MGNRLGDEVLDHAPPTLTHREKLVLVVLAKDANERTRLTWSRVEDPKILTRAKVSRAQMYEVLKALQSKGVLKKTVGGQKNAVAKYEIAHLGPLQCPENPDTDAESQCQETPDTEDSQRPENPDTEVQVQGQEIPDTEAAQCPENPDAEKSQCPENPDAYSTTAGKAGTPAAQSTVHVPDWARPLIDELEARGIVVSWKYRMGTKHWIQLQMLIRDYGVPYLVHLAGLRWNPQTPIKFATLLIEIWRNDYEAPRPGSPWHPDTVAARQAPQGHPQSAPEPDWCGKCDNPGYRFVETDGRWYRCTDCNPGGPA